MNHREIKNKIIKIFATQFSINKDLVLIKLKFEEIDKSFDELDLVEITMEVEDTFDVSISDKEADKWKTVNDIINCIYSKMEMDTEIDVEITRFELMEL